MAKAGSDFLATLKQYKVQSGEFAKATHLLMNGMYGGMLAIPADAHESVYLAFAAAVASGAEIPLLEVPTDWHRFYVDVDLKTAAPVTSKQLLKYARTVQSSVKKFFVMLVNGNKRMREPECFEMAVLLTERPSATASAGASSSLAAPELIYKTGMHLVMPFLHVTAEQCIIMREMIVQDLSEPTTSEWGRMVSEGLCNPIEDQIDRSVYRTKIGGSGSLRMPFAVKWGPCDACNNKKALVSTCLRCNRRGKISLGRPYRAEYIIASHGAVMPKDIVSMRINNSAAQILTYTIRLPTCTGPSPAMPPYAVPADAPLPSDLPDISSNTSSTGTKKTRRGSAGPKMITVVDSEITFAIESAVERAFRQQFGDSVRDYDAERIRVKSVNIILMSPKGNASAAAVSVNKESPLDFDGNKYCKSRVYCVFLTGEYSHCCGNLKDNNIGRHRRSSHYWIITFGGLRQKCTSKKTISDKIKSPDLICSDYRSVQFALQGSERQELFQTHIDLETGRKTGYIALGISMHSGNGSVSNSEVDMEATAAADAAQGHPEQLHGGGGGGTAEERKYASYIIEKYKSNTK